MVMRKNIRRNGEKMEQKFTFEKVTYTEPAPGWVDGVYYPRKEQCVKAEAPLPEAEGAGKGTLKIHSRVWQEIEETGFGIYYYEETLRFMTELSGANYDVTVELENPTAEAYHCHIRVNGIVKVQGVEVAPGERKEVTFTACMTDGQFGLTFATGCLEEIHDKVQESDIYVRNIKIEEAAEKQPRKTPRIFLVSDSTVQSYERYFYPQTGWGQMLYQFFKGAEEYREYPAEHCDYSQGRTYELPELVIENRAIGGRSARSFYDEGKLDQVLEVICPGDYMFVQFAHNDATAIRPNRYIAPAEFQFFLQRYVDACARRKVQIVFVTPVTMLVPKEDGTNQLCFAEYREEMMKLAEREKLPLLDLGGRSNDYVNKIGNEAGKSIYLWLDEGEYPDGAYAGGVSDKCHLQEYGAKVYADMVAAMISESQDDRLETLKELVRPVEVSTIAKPQIRRDAQGKKKAEAPDAVKSFVVQEISIQNGQGSFLLNWNPVEGAASYNVYGRRQEELTFRVVRNVTAEEKEKNPVLPFTAPAGAVWKYYVTAVFENGREGSASRVQEVNLLS